MFVYYSQKDSWHESKNYLKKSDMQKVPYQAGYTHTLHTPAGFKARHGYILHCIHEYYNIEKHLPPHSSHPHLLVCMDTTDISLISIRPLEDWRVFLTHDRSTNLFSEFLTKEYFANAHI